MSYREENGQVILTMSRKDYDQMLMMFAIATARMQRRTSPRNRMELNKSLALLNRLNEGNPGYVPYFLSPSPSSADSTQRERKNL